MNDVIEICAIALEAPAPPLRPAAQALAIARRSTRRRDRLALAASGALVFVLAGSVAVLPATARPFASTGQLAAIAPGGAQPAIKPAAAALPTPTVPTWQAAQRHGKQIASTLAAAVPSGFAVSSMWRTGGPTATWLSAPEPGQYGSFTSLVVSSGDRQGQLEAMIVRDGQSAPTGDLCSATVAARVDPLFGPVPAKATACHVTVVNGVSIRVSSWTDPDFGPVNLAIRMLNGGLLAVEATSRHWIYNSDGALPPDAVNPVPPAYETPAAAPPALAAPVLTGDQLAQLAADSALLP